jgi:methionyl-tRNA formyltransferase
LKRLQDNLAMNLVFAGTPPFAVPALEALLAAGHRIAAVYTQPDRPAGRGRKLALSAVKECALAHGLPVHQPDSLKPEAEAARLRALAPEAMIVIAYGLLLPASILAVPKHGCLNVHASLLPRWRGAAPIARAIEAGDSESGVTVMQMEEGLDTGPMLLKSTEPIHTDDTAASLHDRLALLGARTLVEALAIFACGALTPERQDNALACYARKLKKEEAVIDWTLDAAALHRRIRAFNPWPVATTTWRGERLRLWEVGPMQSGSVTAAPGTVISAGAGGVCVATGNGALALTRLQREGGRLLSAGEFVNGTRLAAGEVFG